MSEAFAYECYRGSQSMDYPNLDPISISAMHYGSDWNPDRPPSGDALVREVWAHCACHAIARFREWQSEGHGNNWLLLRPVGRECKLYTVVFSYQEKETPRLYGGLTDEQLLKPMGSNQQACRHAQRSRHGRIQGDKGW